MKKGIFSFTTIFTFLFILIFTAACSSSNQETADTETGEHAEELASNQNESATEIDYAEEGSTEEDGLEVEETLTSEDTKDKKVSELTDSKTTSTTTTKKTIENSGGKQETAPKRPTTTSSNVETAPTKTSSSLKTTNDNVETVSKKSTDSKKLETKSVSKPAKPFSHGAWDDLLRKNVSSSGKVNYAGFKKDKAKLDAYLKLLSANEPSGKSRNDQIAYWINAYNAFTVDLIVDNYPVSSILKLDNGKTWMVKRITIGGKKYSLEDIEKKILIGKFKEARIHFAINCAAKSCPPLKNRAWKGSSLNSDLDRASRNFINNTTYNTIEKKSANLSQIFNWYKGDFSDVNEFINKYADNQITSKTKVNYTEYNWDLNK